VDRGFKKKGAPKLLRIVNGVFFSVFSFVFLYCVQGELLSEAQSVYSNGLTTYSLLPGALIITFILMLVQWFVTSVFNFNDDYYALSYFPSCLLLGILTSIDVEVLANFTLGNLVWVLPLILLLYVGVLFFLKKISFVRGVNIQKNYAKSLWVNALILLVMFISVGSYANNNDVFTYELKTERLIIEGEYDEALEVGKKSLCTSRKLTELRMFALAKNGTLNDKMFDYPQYYGADGLLDISDTLSRLYRFSSKDICAEIGLFSDSGMSTREYLERAYYIVDSLKFNDEAITESTDTTNVHENINAQMAMDYYCAYLLLDKNIEKFCSLLDSFETKALPKVYGESVLLAYENRTDSIVENQSELLCMTSMQRLYELIDKDVLKQREEYLSIKDSLADSVECMNRLRRKFGNTYWWYYDYSQQVSNPVY
jgi:hypothetical protein